VVWAYYTDDATGISAWDFGAGSGQTVSSDTGGAFADSLPLWHAGDVFWLRQYFAAGGPSRCELISRRPDGGASKVILKRAHIEWVGNLGGRLGWTERDSKGNRALWSKPFNAGKAKRVASLGTSPVQVASSADLFAWVESGSVESRAHRLHVLALGSGHDAVLDLPISASPKATFEPGSLTASGRRLAWFATDDASGTVAYTWSIGDSRPTQVIAPTPLASMTPNIGVPPALSGDRLAWIVEDVDASYLLTWTSAGADSQVVATWAWPAFSADVPAVDGDRICWIVSRPSEASSSAAEEGDTSSALYVWEAVSSRVTTLAGPTLDEANPGMMWLHGTTALVQGADVGGTGWLFAGEIGSRAQ
jgi:hypothetical protein